MKGKKKTYTVLGNYRFIYGELWREDKSCIFFSIAEILFGVAVAFGAILMPSLMIGMLERGLCTERCAVAVVSVCIWHHRQNLLSGHGTAAGEQ